ncbi:hypothetical protein ACNFCJ_14730 [Pseudomonas sp. NY15364]|uniref:hypothetical protein n=1 Tax=Pseudomonas sp. NY15364 TaxID=3400353 RepID=UPI003A8906CE
MNKQCVNCPGATDHTTAECPVMCEQMKMDADPVREIARQLGIHVYGDGLLAKIRDTIALLKDEAHNCKQFRELIEEQARASLPVGVPGAEHVLIQAVAVTRDDEEEGLRLEWLLEGGIAEMEFAGQVLFAMPEANSLCDEDGSAHVYIAPPPDPTAKESLSVAASDVLAERQRQITAEGYDSGHDDMATRGQLAIAAGCYAIWSGHPALMGAFSWKSFFPWDWKYWKPSTPRHNLIKAGALILAEIERLDRAEQAKHQEKQP